MSHVSGSKKLKRCGGGGLHSIEQTCFSPAAPGLILGVPKNFSLDVAEINWRQCLEQWTKGLIMSFEPILYWLVASWYYKKEAHLVSIFSAQMGSLRSVRHGNTWVMARLCELKSHWPARYPVTQSRLRWEWRSIWSMAEDEMLMLNGWILPWDWIQNGLLD